MGSSNATENPFVVQLNYHGDKTRQEYLVFPRGSILLESVLVKNSNGIWKCMASKTEV